MILLKILLSGELCGSANQIWFTEPHRLYSCWNNSDGTISIVIITLYIGIMFTVIIIGTTRAIGTLSTANTNMVGTHWIEIEIQSGWTSNHCDTTQAVQTFMYISCRGNVVEINLLMFTCRISFKNHFIYPTRDMLSSSSMIQPCTCNQVLDALLLPIFVYFINTFT